MKHKNKVIKPIIKIFRSNQYIYAQVLDNGNVVESSSSLKNKKEKKGKMTKTEEAKSVGIDLAKKLLKKKVETVVIKRGKYQYLGRLKALVEGLREGGLKV